MDAKHRYNFKPLGNLGIEAFEHLGIDQPLAHDHVGNAEKDALPRASKRRSPLTMVRPGPDAS